MRDFVDCRMSAPPNIWAGCSLTVSSPFFPTVAWRLRGLAQEPRIARLTLNFFDGRTDEEMCANCRVIGHKVALLADNSQPARAPPQRQTAAITPSPLAG